MTNQCDAVIFVQARISSKRLPGKVLKQVYHKPLLGYLLDRLQTSGLPIWMLIPDEEREFFSRLQSLYPRVSFFEGSQFNVLKRFYDASKVISAVNYVRVTGDNPFTSIHCLKCLLEKHLQEGADLSFYQNLPYGAGVEILSRRALKHTYRYAKTSYDHEHVTAWLHRRIFSSKNYKDSSWKGYTSPAPQKYYRPDLRLTVDTPEDFRLFRLRVKRLRERGLSFSLNNLLTME